MRVYACTQTHTRMHARAQIQAAEPSSLISHVVPPSCQRLLFSQKLLIFIVLSREGALEDSPTPATMNVSVVIVQGLARQPYFMGSASLSPIEDTVTQ